MKQSNRLSWTFLYLTLTCGCASFAAAGSTSTLSGEVTATRLAAPIAFQANKGQAGSDVRYLARARGYTLLMTDHEAVVVPVASRAAVRMRFAPAAGAARVEGVEELPGKVNYLLGGDPGGWRTGVPLYRKVRYRDVYPGIDAVFYGRDRQLEYDLLVSPGADPGRIRLTFDGARVRGPDAAGDLLLEAADGVLRLRRPVAYQDAGGERRQVAGRYRVGRGGEVRIVAEGYDRTKPLVIDPIISYSTYLGGSWMGELGSGSDGAGAIATDADANVYVTGYTTADDFPTTAGSYLGQRAGGRDAFLTKFGPTGTMLYSTYLGGASDDEAHAIAVDPEGNVYVTGVTTSDDFPVAPVAVACKILPCAYQRHRAGATDAFVTKLSPSGAMLYSTYLGGASHDEAHAIAAGTAGEAYVAGKTLSLDFPTTESAHQREGDCQIACTIDPPGMVQPDAFVTKLNAEGTAILYSTYLGGGHDDVAYAIAVDASGHAYVAGETGSDDFDTRAGCELIDPPFGFQCRWPFQVGLKGPKDAFVSKLGLDGGLLWSSYLGGSGSERGNGIALKTVDTIVEGTRLSRTEVYVAGETYSHDFPLHAPFQNVHAGGLTDAFVTRLDSLASSLVYSTYLGGSEYSPTGEGDAAAAIAVDADGNAYVAGYTPSTDTPGSNHDTPYNVRFPLMRPVQTSCGGCPGVADAFVAKLDPSGALSYSTFLGGGLDDRATGIAVGPAGAAYVAGRTASQDFPTVAAAYPEFGAGIVNPYPDAFAVKLVDRAAGSVDLSLSHPSASPNPAVEGQPLHYSVEVRNDTSTDASGVALVEALSPEATLVSVDAGAADCALTAAKKLICNFTTLVAGDQATVAITVVPNERVRRKLP